MPPRQDDAMFPMTAPEWIKRHHGPEFVHDRAATARPSHASASETAAVRAVGLLERLRFMADQGLHAGEPRVDDAVRALLACRDADGRFADHESPASFVPGALADVEARHVLWRLGYDMPPA